jgi:hypothetical protein
MATYAILLSRGADELVAFKATSDPTTESNWSQQDTAIKVRDGELYPIRSVWVYESGSDLHVVTQQYNTRVAYHVFDPGTDTWTTRDEIAAPIGGLGAGLQSSPNIGAGVVLRSDGDVVVACNGWDATGAISGIYYTVKSGGSWSTPVIVQGSATGLGAVVLGASDRTHFLYSLGTTIRHRSLSSTDVLDTAKDAATDGVAGGRHNVGPGVSYVSTQTKVRVPYEDTNGYGRMIKFDSGAGPTIATEKWTDGTNLVETFVGVSLLAATNKGTDLYAVYVNDTDSDIDYDKNADDGGWGTDAQAVSAITATTLSANYYDRSGDKLGLLWENGSDQVRCDEVTLAAAAQTVTPSATSATFSVAAPTLVPGEVTLTPSAVVISSAIAAPTVVPGDITLTPNATSAAWTTVAPTLEIGTVFDNPDPVIATFAVAAPTVVPGDVSVSPNAVSATFAVAAPTVTNAKTAAPNAVSATLTVVAPTLVPGEVTLTPSAVVATFAVAAPTTLETVNPSAVGTRRRYTRS